ncbi:hypothetical protein VTK73DRAFT_9317 [Phialemonium thermophilum]|uniref:F-box domain-containing protein n=1 Tax=Phialemonium thermophilum TaxID=223376 RepID=A0ABR3W346_9PEZI
MAPLAKALQRRDAACPGRNRSPSTPLHLLDLPPEIHLLISRQLIYPDALSLRFTNRYFFHLVDTGIRLKIAWLVERRQLRLECPNDRRCDLRSDFRFCQGKVQLLIQWRREHLECESRPGLGCLVYGTKTCVHRHRLPVRIKHWLAVLPASGLWWMSLFLVPLACCWWWMAAAQVVGPYTSPTVSHFQRRLFARAACAS